MNKKENYLTAIRGGVPEWIPNYSTDCQLFAPSALGDVQGALYSIYYELLEKGEVPQNVKMKDAFGITWILDEYGAITEPGNILLEEISEWHEKFTIPDLVDYDWDSELEKDKAMLDPEKAVQIIVNGPFMSLVNAMGFEGALMAMAIDEEETIEFFDAVCSFQEKAIINTLKRVHCDSLQLFDDIANAKNLFMSPAMFRKLLKPYQKRLIDAAKSVEPDIIIEMHCCGFCEDVIDDFIEIGCTVWQPAQPLNNLKSIHKKYGNKLVFTGAWSNVTLTGDKEVSEEIIRQSVRDVIDDFAREGAFVFWTGGPVGTSQTMAARLAWADNEADVYGQKFYKN